MQIETKRKEDSPRILIFEAEIENLMPCAVKTYLLARFEALITNLSLNYLNI